MRAAAAAPRAVADALRRDSVRTQHHAESSMPAGYEHAIQTIGELLWTGREQAENRVANAKRQTTDCGRLTLTLLL